MPNTLSRAKSMPCTYLSIEASVFGAPKRSQRSCGDNSCRWRMISSRWDATSFCTKPRLASAIRSAFRPRCAQTRSGSSSARMLAISSILPLGGRAISNVRALVTARGRLTRSGAQLARRKTVDAARPAREMALVGKSRSKRDLGQRQPPLLQQGERPLQAQLHDVTVWRHPDRAREHPREVESALSRNARERGDVDWLVQMGVDVFGHTRKRSYAQRAASGPGRLRQMPLDEVLHDPVGDAIPVERAVAEAGRRLGGERFGETLQRGVAARQPLRQRRTETGALRGGQREPLGRYNEREHFEPDLRIEGEVHARRADGERT